ncbi:MAG: hypothetical protein ACE5GB_08615 [Acidimicrobiales bacterium]
MASPPLVLSRRPRQQRALPRPRLLARADRSPLVCLVGPAGIGKTIIAGQLADLRPGRVGWCRLAPGYGDAADLVVLAGRSLATITDGHEDVLTLAGELLEMLEIAPTTLVIDDYHEAEGDRCDQLLGEVLPLLPTEARVIVTSRSRPAALLGRLRGSEVTVLDADDIAFTDDEAADLFASRGRDPRDAEEWQRATTGWATALAVAAESPPGSLTTSDDIADSVVRAVLDDPRLTSSRPLLFALAVLPYLTDDLVRALDLGPGQSLVELGRLTSLVVEADGFWRLHPTLATALATRTAETDAADLRRRAAAAVTATDPGTAIELHLAAQDFDSAGEVLRQNLSTVGPDRAMRWLYVMPAELRRTFPPSLSAGRATVNLDTAIGSARRRVAEAADDHARFEALLALGSVHAARGELADAADALDTASRLGGHDATADEAVHLQLAMVRWWAGDVAGSHAALDRSGDGTWSHWVRGQLWLAAGDAARVDQAARDCLDATARDQSTTEAPGLALAAMAALLRGDVEAAAPTASSSYRAGIGTGGLDLVAGAVAHGWTLAALDRGEEVLAVVGVLERRVGRQDMHARVQAAMFRRALATTSDTETRERDERRVRDLRRLGFAPLEVAARELSRQPANRAAGVRVQLLGRFSAAVDGHPLPTDRWRSKKALEVLAYLALAGEGGARREQVIEAVWPSREPERGRTLLRTALSEIRRVLEPDRQRGEPSRYVDSSGDRVLLRAACDVNEARVDPTFAVLGPGVAPDAPDSEWIEEVRTEVRRLRLESAERAAAAGGADAMAALEMLVDDEPWNRRHFDALIALHRQAGDEAAANAIERRWFEDD